MFGCSKCEVYAEEVKYLREELRKTTDRLLAATNLQAYQAVSLTAPSGEFYGGEGDEQIEYGQYGQKMLVTKKQ